MPSSLWRLIEIRCDGDIRTYVAHLKIHKWEILGSLSDTILKCNNHDTQ